MKTLLCLVALLAQLAAPAQTVPEALHRGALLRMHVVAHDDTGDMQRVKLRVRDAVRDTYASHRSSGSMLRQTRDMLPELIAAAESAASREGFTGPVAVTLGMNAFDERTLAGCTIPAGEYPALIIRLGEGRGHNWWGLIDPDMALSCAELPTAEAGVQWDWSFSALLEAIFGHPLPWEVPAHD